jgi:hypothetical protein
MHERVVGPRPRGDLLHERHQLVAQTVQQRLETCHAHVGLVLVEQRVIALAALVADRVGLLAAQREEALQRLPELREIRLGARDLPGLETRRLGKRQLAHERGRDTYCSVALAPRLAYARRLEGAEVRIAAQLRDRVPEALVADTLVQHARKRRLGLAAGRSAARRHVDLLVPVEHAPDPSELANIALELLEDVPGSGLLQQRHQGLSGLWPWTASIMPISQPRPAIAKPQAKRLWIPRSRANTRLMPASPTPAVPRRSGHVHRARMPSPAPSPLKMPPSASSGFSRWGSMRS